MYNDNVTWHLANFLWFLRVRTFSNCKNICLNSYLWQWLSNPTKVSVLVDPWKPLIPQVGYCATKVSVLVDPENLLIPQVSYCAILDQSESNGVHSYYNLGVFSLDCTLLISLSAQKIWSKSIHSFRKSIVKRSVACFCATSEFLCCYLSLQVYTDWFRTSESTLYIFNAVTVIPMMMYFLSIIFVHMWLFV